MFPDDSHPLHQTLNEPFLWGKTQSIPFLLGYVDDESYQNHTYYIHYLLIEKKKKIMVKVEILLELNLMEKY